MKSVEEQFATRDYLAESNAALRERLKSALAISESLFCPARWEPLGPTNQPEGAPCPESRRRAALALLADLPRAIIPAHRRTIAAIAENLGIERETASRALSPTQQHLVSADLVRKVRQQAAMFLVEEA